MRAVAAFWATARDRFSVQTLAVPILQAMYCVGRVDKAPDALAAINFE